MTLLAPDIQAGLNDYWSRRATAYHADQQRPDRIDGDRALWSGIWSDAVGPAPARVADLGTGSGYVAWLLHDLGHEVTGVDAAAGMIEVAQAHRDDVRSPRFVVGDAQQPPLAARSLDAVTARHVLWTLRDPASALSRWRELLRPGGILAVVDGLWFPDHLPSAPGVRAVGPGTREIPEAAVSWTPAEQFARVYAEAVGAGALPLASGVEVADLVAVVTGAGFVDVQVEALTEVYARDRAHGVPAGHEPTLQYLIRGRAPR
ncbi:MAG: methyltransferase domain-containing protein [Propionibacteriaceae bacterium]|nr:methyltransferase domain-containing protein [Propionibacteriaceae bacterium]